VHMDKTCVYEQDMCICKRHVYKDKPFVYEYDMCLRIRHMSTDKTCVYGQHILQPFFGICSKIHQTGCLSINISTKRN
jgi:hypothetical protein